MEQKKKSDIAYLMITPNPAVEDILGSKNDVPVIYIKSGDTQREDRAKAYDTDNPSYYACWWIFAEEIHGPGKLIEGVFEEMEGFKRWNTTEWYRLEDNLAHKFAAKIVEEFKETFPSKNNKVEEGASLKVTDTESAKKKLKDWMNGLKKTG